MNERLGFATAIICLLVLSACGGGEPRSGSAGDADRGRELVAAYGCGACHTVPGVRGATAVVGPPLWGIADRAYLAGVVPNTEPSMIRWIMDPQEVNPGTAMPDLAVSARDATDIAAYFATLGAESQTARLMRGILERLSGQQVRPGTVQEAK